jgi:succinate dehydrogenase / fumarate reductase cytochrome b subunit
MSSRLRVLASSVGTKILIGLTGLFLAFYLIIHIGGNLVVFLGPETFNQYSYTLASNPLIPVIEIVLLAGFLVHIYKAVRMYLANRQARPVSYAMKKRAGPPSRKTLASSTMIASGLWLLVFVVVHVRTFKFGAHPVTAEGITDLYQIEMDAFRSPLAVAFYVLSMVVVGSHLWHGVVSGFQSLGADHPKWTPRIKVVARLLAFGIPAAFIVIALWAHFGGGRT